MSVPNIIILGSGGHAHSCIDVIEQDQRFEISGVIDNNKKVGEKVLGYTIIGSDTDLPNLRKKFDYAFIGIGQIKSFETKISLFKTLQKLGFQIPFFISPHAYFSPHAKIGKGSIVMHGAIINSKARIGCNTIINSNALVEHNTIVGDHCHISTSSVLNGGVKVCSRSFIGSGSIIIENITIGKSCFIGASSFVKNNLSDGKKFLER